MARLLIRSYPFLPLSPGIPIFLGGKPVRSLDDGNLLVANASATNPSSATGAQQVAAAAPATSAATATLSPPISPVDKPVNELDEPTDEPDRTVELPAGDNTAADASAARPAATRKRASSAFERIRAFDLNAELTTHDNKAVAISYTGYTIAAALIMNGALAFQSGANPGNVYANLLLAVLWIVVGFLLLFLSHICE